MARAAQDERCPTDDRHPGRRTQRIGLRRLVGWAASCRSRPARRSTAGCSVELMLDDADARVPQGDARGGARLPRRRPWTSCRTSSRSSAGSTTSVVVVLAVDLFLDGVPRTCWTRSCTSWASTGARSARTSPGSGGSCRARPPARSGACLDARRSRRGYAGRYRGSDRGSGPGSTRRNSSREGHPDPGRRDARQERRDEGRGRRLRPQLPHPPQAGRAGGRRRLSRVAARHRQPRGEAQARARGGRDRGHSASAAPRSRWASRSARAASSTARSTPRTSPRRSAGAGSTIDRHKIDLEEPLKSLGTYKVAIKVLPGHDARGHDRRRAQGLTSAARPAARAVPRRCRRMRRRIARVSGRGRSSTSTSTRSSRRSSSATGPSCAGGR